jgi:hypothetical protein
VSSSRFTLWLNQEAEEILESIEKGEKSNFICKAIVAYQNQLNGHKGYKTTHLEVLSTISDRLGEISNSLGNITFSAGNVGQKPRE